MSEETKNPFDLVDQQPQSTKSISNEISQKGGQFLENLVRKVAKLLGLPDPKPGTNEGTETTDKPTNDKKNTTNQNTTLEQDVASQEGEKKAFNFDSIMSGVTGVLKDIGEKVSEKTGIDLNNPLKKKEDSLDNEKPEANNTKGNETPENKAA